MNKQVPAGFFTILIFAVGLIAGALIKGSYNGPATVAEPTPIVQAEALPCIPDTVEIAGDCPKEMDPEKSRIFMNRDLAILTDGYFASIYTIENGFLINEYGEAIGEVPPMNDPSQVIIEQTPTALDPTPDIKKDATTGTKK